MTRMTRNTHQKQSVQNAVQALRGRHPTAETVYERVSQTIPSISRATVYRILKRMTDDGTIAHLHIPESADHYDDIVQPHHHLLCTVCKQVVDLAAPDIPEISLPADDISGCRITGVEIMFHGVCPECNGAVSLSSAI